MVKGKAIDDRVVTGRSHEVGSARKTGGKRADNSTLSSPEGEWGIAKQGCRMNVVAGDRPRGVVGETGVGS
jgi:hypothetical protein